MRIGFSFKILPGVRVGISRSTGRRGRTRVYASERLFGVRVSESGTVGGKKRRRTR